MIVDSLFTVVPIVSWWFCLVLVLLCDVVSFLEL